MEPTQELWVPAGARQQVLQKQLAAVGAQVVKDGDDTYTMVRMGGGQGSGGEDFYYLPIEDQVALDLNRRLAKSRGDRDPQPQEYNLATMPTALGQFSGVKQPQYRYRSANDLLREIPRRNPVISGAIGRRQDQVAQFGRPAKRKDGGARPGFDIEMRDELTRPSPAALKKMKEIKLLLLRGGYLREHPDTGELGVWDAEFGEQALRFDQALRQLVWDSITFDAAAFRIEVGENERKYPVVWFKPVDASLIRYAVVPETGKYASAESRGFAPDVYEPQIRRGLRTEYVMLDNQGTRIIREFAWNELAYLTRNSRTDLRQSGYGMSVLEELVDIISGILFGVAFNNEYFNNSHIPPMILALKGADWKPQVIQAFQQQLRVMCGGPGAWWAMPIISSESPTAAAEVIPLRNMDGVGMFWREWLLFCISVVAMRLGFDPAELNATVFGSSENALAQQQPLGKIQYARESGLVPLVEDFFNWFDRMIVWRMEPDFRLVPRGLNPLDPNEERAARQDRMQWAISTPNLERAMRDELPLRFALDQPLWREVRESVAEHHGMDISEMDYVDDRELEEEAAQAYLKAEGKFSVAYDMPVGNGFAFQMIQQELQEAQQEKQQAEQQAQMAQQGEQGGTPGAPPQQQLGTMQQQQQLALPPGQANGNGNGAAGGGQAFPPTQAPPGQMAPAPAAGAGPMQKSRGRGFWRTVYELIAPPGEEDEDAEVGATRS